MPDKEIRIFDSSNNPLPVNGIHFDLCDAVTGTLLATDYSHDLNPGPHGAPSNQWGVRLNFNPGANPLDVYTSDPTYQYPGNMLQYLEGRLQDRIDIDLLKVLSGPGGQATPLPAAAPAAVSKWVEQGRRWSEEEKRAVRNLIFNYTSAFVPRLDALSKLVDLGKVAQNWEEAMSRLGISVSLLKT